MPLFTKIKEKKKLLVGIAAFVFMTFIVFEGVLPNAFATTDYYLANASVELDGTNNGEVVINFNTPIADSIFSVRGVYDTTAAGGNFTLTTLTPATGITPNSNSIGDGTIYWFDSTWTAPLVLGEREAMWSATYTVNKDTPADTYSICMTETEVASLSEDYDTAWLGTVCSTVTVTRTDTTPSKLPQTIILKDGEGHDITGTTIEKYYGDEPFEVTWEHTVGNGAVSYHPDDDEFSEHVARTAGSNIEIDNVGQVDICAWAEETEDYAAAQACITVRVSKRPLDIVGATIANKTYDGTTTATVTDVDFSDRDLASAEYEATATFDDADAGADKVVHVSVNLIGGAENNYILNASNYNTAKTIDKYLLTSENMSISGGSTQIYTPGGVEPGVVVTANTHGGLTTLGSDDYDVEYADNTAVGAATIRVTGKGNFTTGTDPVVLNFNIEPRGINNDNVTAPNEIVEGHILTKDEISVNVDGVALAQCANPGDPDCDYTVAITGDNDGVVGHVVNVAINACNNYTGVGARDINIVEKLPQIVSFGDITGSTIEKSYGDADFTYTATTEGDGAITYDSSDGTVATVDASGKVTIKGVGEADIIATAAETGTYAEGTAGYHVVVSKKVVTVSSVLVNNKPFDNTPVATVTDVVLSEGSLIYGTDFTATGLFNDVTPAVRNVNVLVALSDDAYTHYCFTYESSCIKNTSYDTSAAILPFTLTSDNTTATLSSTTYEYDGEAKEPTATVSVDLDGDGTKETTLVAGTDYTISYSDNVNASPSAKATIIGKGNYTGSLSALTFTIDPASVTNVQVTAPAQTYTGSALEPVPTVTGEVNGSIMTFDADVYIMLEHEDFIDAGDHTFTIGSKVGSNYYIAHTNGTFTINKADSGEPAEMTSGLSVEVGKILADLGDLSEGFAWVDSSATIASGMNNYEATYTKNGDTTNYTTVSVSVPVLGFTEEYEVIEGAGQEHVIDPSCGSPDTDWPSSHKGF